VRFDVGAKRDEDVKEPPDGAGNAWYLYVPPAMVGIWLVVAIARVVALMLEPGDISSAADPSAAEEGIRLAVAAVDWIGGVGWVLLFGFYFVLLSRRRAPAWWSLGAFCLGPNFLVYIVLLLVPQRRSAMARATSPMPPTLGGQKLRRPVAFVLEGTFVCEACDSLLNYGVSECGGCGARYEYSAEESSVEHSTR
jgi:hypothetical protein